MKRVILPAVLLLVTVAAFAQDQLSTPPDGTRAVRLLERRLSLSPTQISQAKAILQQERPTLQHLHTQLAAEHTAMASRSTFDEASTRAIAAQYAETNTSALVEREKLRSELFAVLTPAQQQKLQQLRARFGARIDERLQTLGDSL